jgi:hypothetical protein
MTASIACKASRRAAYPSSNSAARAASTVMPAWAACSHACLSKLVLPIPASPSTSSADPEPEHADWIAAAIAPRSVARSSSRPAGARLALMVVMVRTNVPAYYPGTRAK